MLCERLRIGKLNQQTSPFCPVSSVANRGPMSTSLQAIHFKELTASAQARNSLTDRDASPVLLPLAKIQIRCVGLNDRGYAKRMAWVRALLPKIQEREYRHDDYTAFMQASQNFDLVIVHGQDMRRLMRIAARFRAIMPGKITVALLPTRDPAATCRLLNAAFDDVLDLDMPHAEAKARICGLERRRIISSQQASKKPTHDPMEQKIAELAHSCQLSRRDKRVLGLLIRKSGRTIHYWQLARVLDKDLDRHCKRSIHVRMHNIRRCLKNKDSLITVRGEGYQLAA